MLAANRECPNPRSVTPLFDTASAVAPEPRRHYLRAGGLDLLPLTIHSKNLFDHYVAEQSFVVADLSFANNFIWLTRMSAFYQVIDDCFCLFSLNGNRLGMLLPPIGATHNQVSAIDTCFAAMDAYNGDGRDSCIDFVNSETAALLRDDPRWQLQPTHPDYLYRSEELIELRGNNYKTKRSEINQFQRNYPQAELAPLDPVAHHDGIRALYHTWLKGRLQNAEVSALGELLASMELERQGIERALKHYHALGLAGLVLLIDGVIAGFTFGERLNPQVASILVEKTDVAISGAAQFLFREFARGFADRTYINVGDDLGLENLRRVKMSYRPVMFGEKFSLCRTNPF